MLVDPLDERVGEPLAHRGGAATRPRRRATTAGSGRPAMPFASSTSRSVASGRRASRTSSTRSQQVGFGMSSYTASWPALTIAMSRPAADRVVEERRVHRLPHRRCCPGTRTRRCETPPLVLGPGQRRLDLAHGLEELERVAVVLREARRDREHVRVEDDVPAGKPPRSVDQEAVRARGDLDLALRGRPPARARRTP